MKTGTKIIIAIAGFIVFCAWITNQIDGIKKAKWLIRTWENKTPEGSIYETWNKTNNTEFAGKSYIVKEKDTIVFENIQRV
ncbi:hypothetical protein A8C56_06660 [Niabella ginsenosidivorans]|uniref:Uncharacterized protein n=1 Tax=Niabella ginsenosidivorans TaxID=1176587 RepID=A0A1A9I0U7_9BACT|nr:hypothetical protein [Niabella ginsenosidivorans]ANH80699.1 hypothetical protein A8C56_06660 [Niabella ginsenosidivorans]